MSDIDAVTQAARAHQRTGAALRRAVAEAKHAGSEVSAIARAAGVTRQTIYRWIASEGEVRPLFDVGDALDEALLLLATIVGEPGATTLRKRHGHPRLEVRALGVQIGMANLPHDIQDQLTGDELQILSAGALVLDRGRNYHRKYGEWPRTVPVGFDD